MLVKRYHVKNMQEAMDTVIKELGPDAVILNSRKFRRKGFRNLFKKPIFEVTVAYDPAKVPMAKKAAGTYSPYSLKVSEPEAALPPPAAETTADREARELTARKMEELDNRIDSLGTALNEFMTKFSYVKRDLAYNYSPDVEALFCRLMDNQVRDEVAHSLAKETEAILKRQDTSSAIEIMEHLIREHLGSPEPIQPKKFAQKVVLLLGPTGVGKTTSLVKLAADFCVKQKKKVGIINTDTYRIAAQEQLKAYADILGIPLAVVYQPTEISAAIESMEDREVIFIDTAGKRPGDEQHRADVMKIIELAAPEDVLLCVAASTSFAAMTEVIDTYGFVDQYKLVITKLDETRYRGIILNVSWYARRALAYVTTGQNVPDDIAHADMDDIVNQLLR